MKTAMKLHSTNWEASQPIPRMTDPQGRHWEEPDRSRILIDDTHALMSHATFEELNEYSGSRPTGVYPGKMWKRFDGVYDMEFRARGGKPVWLLCWYGECSQHPPPCEQCCSNHRRQILLVDGELPEDCKQ